MKMAIDEPGRYGPAREAHHSGLLTDPRLENVELAMGDDPIASDHHGVALRMAQDDAAMQNEVSFFETYHRLTLFPQDPPVIPAHRRPSQGGLSRSSRSSV